MFQWKSIYWKHLCQALFQVETIKDSEYNSSKYQYFPVLCFKLQIIF